MPAPGAAFFLSMNIYIDESGNLGFSFQKPYRKGGSSRYLTITFLLIPKNLSHHTKRIVRNFFEKKKKSTKNEIKGKDLSDNDKLYIAERTNKLLQKHRKIRIISITVNKRRVRAHIRDDPNKLYNYMVGLVLPKKIKNQDRVTLIPDKRSIKVASGNSMVDYLKVKLWFESDSKTIIDYEPLESHTALNLQYIDWISNIIWNKYEDDETEILDIFEKRIELIKLFF